jgi:hypothetical protein
VKILLSALSDSYGLRVRSGAPPCRLRQPGRIPPSLSGAATILACSPIHIPPLHMDAKQRTLTLSPGVSKGFLPALAKLGRGVQRNLSPQCRSTAEKRQAAAEALQNVCAMRSGARSLLSVGVSLVMNHSGHLSVLCCTSLARTAKSAKKVAASHNRQFCLSFDAPCTHQFCIPTKTTVLCAEHGLHHLCSAVYTQTLIGQVAIVEACYSCILHFPKCRSDVYNTGFDHALKHALSDTGEPAAIETFMRTWTILSSDRGTLSGDSSECTMFV